MKSYPVSGVMSPVINWIAKFTGCWFENGDLPIENGDFIYGLLVTGTMEFYDFPLILGMSSSQLLLTPSLSRGIGIPPTS